MKKREFSAIERVIFGMLTENTGISFFDSGGENGRMWQKNKNKKIEDFASEPAVQYDIDFTEWSDEKKTRVDIESISSDEICFTVSLFHYLPDVLELDTFCDEYNALACDDWDGEAYGVSEKGQEWLKSHGLTYGASWNTCNGEDNLSQVLQGTNLTTSGNESSLVYPDYVLLQIHGGADVRGGYTNAKLFRVRENCYVHPTPDISATLIRENGKVMHKLDMRYDGLHLRDEDGEAIIISKKDTLTVYPAWAY
jgi:hypothetical protein